MPEGAKAETKKKEKKERKTAVTIIAAKGESTLVEWVEGGSQRRGYIPTDQLEDSKTTKTVLKAAMPYGAPWADYIDVSGLTPESLQAELHKRGVWCARDLERRPKEFTRAVMTLLGTTAPALRRHAVSFEKGE